MQTLEHVHPLGTHHVVVSREGRTAASAGFGGEVRVWELVGDEGEVGMWREKGSILPVLKKGTRRGKEAENGTTPTTPTIIRTDTKPWALALSPTGTHLATTTPSGNIYIYALQTQLSATPTATLTSKTSSSFPLCIDISPSATLTAVGHSSGTLALYNNASSRLTHTLPSLHAPIRAVRFSPGSTYLAAAGDARIIALYDVNSGEQVANLSGHGAWVMDLDWSWDGGMLVSGGWDGRVKVWDVGARACVATLTEGEDGGSVWGMRWVSGGKERGGRFVVGGAKGEVRVVEGGGWVLRGV